MYTKIYLQASKYEQSLLGIESWMDVLHIFEQITPLSCFNKRLTSIKFFLNNQTKYVLMK